MKVSILQLPIEEGSLEHNLDAMSAMLDKTMNSSQRPDTILLPELWNTGFYPKPISQYADSQDNWKNHMGRLAAEYTVNIVAGSIAVEHDKNIYNTCYIFDRAGKNTAFYEKTHLFSPAREDQDFTPGSRLTVFQLDSIKCGIIICYDLRFPEIARQLALQDISILFVAAAWPIERIQHWDTLLRARAIENQIFVAGANGISPNLGDSMHLGGGSAIYDPWGCLLAQGSTDDLEGEILQANLQPGRISQIRRDINIFQDRRPELYTLKRK
ncbi:MAG: carbon-nitrogen family hydrolase [Anaerovibrio sp.]|nr:carbon-nitrogen family hydrolase [Anaerovibrio sp.]